MLWCVSELVSADLVTLWYMDGCYWLDLKITVPTNIPLWRGPRGPSVLF
jgi:hypothetical protein